MMKATLKTFTALTVVLALSGEAVAQSNFSPMVKPNLTNLAKPNFVKPPVIISNGVKPINPNMKPIVRPQVVRPAIAPRADVSRLANKPDAQTRKKAERQARKQRPAKQAGTPLASIRELPPLPRPKPDRQVIAELPPLPRPKPNYDAGPQPEPPTLEANAGASGLPGSDNGAFGEVGNVAGLEAMRDILGDVALGQELARLGDLRDLLGGNDAIDDGAIGGGGSGNPSSWLGMVPESNTGDAGPQNDKVWKPEAPGNSAYNRDPSGDQGGGFTPPARGKRDGSNNRGFGQTSGSARAGAGLRFGGSGTTSQDPVPSNDSEEEQDNAYESAGALINEAIDNGFDGEEDSDAEKFVRVLSAPGWVPFVVIGAHLIETVRSPLPGVELWDWQPNPEEAGSGQSMPCPHTSTGCGPSDGPMSYQPSKWDKVGQPGKGENDQPAQGFTASVTERKNVVSQPNPADTGGGPRGGGGAGGLPECHPICHVTGGGSGGPAKP